MSTPTTTRRDFLTAAGAAGVAASLGGTMTVHGQDAAGNGRNLVPPLSGRTPSQNRLSLLRRTHRAHNCLPALMHMHVLNGDLLLAGLASEFRQRNQLFVE